MAYGTTQASRDWLAGTSSNLIAWWIPHATLLAGLFVPNSDSSRHLDRGSALDGRGVHSQREALWPHALPLHRALLSCDDLAGRLLASFRWALMSGLRWAWSSSAEVS